MNSRQYEKMMNEALAATLANFDITPDDCTQVCLSGDRTKYEVVMKDGSTRIIPSGFEYFED
jgi:hypothetical protein